LSALGFGLFLYYTKNPVHPGKWTGFVFKLTNRLQIVIGWFGNVSYLGTYSSRLLLLPHTGAHKKRGRPLRQPLSYVDLDTMELL
ncbi:MAG: hypothetical protein FWC16_00005, partial [Defluviitaleaceae bacterium]|nr:hypothetical protein [Defluviitaleaceae bacterium]